MVCKDPSVFDIANNTNSGHNNCFLTYKALPSQRTGLLALPQGLCTCCFQGQEHLPSSISCTAILQIPTETSSLW